TGTGDAVQGLVPPFVLGQAESFDRRRVVLHLRGFFLQRHLRHQRSCALLERLGGVHPRTVAVIGLQAERRQRGQQCDRTAADQGVPRRIGAPCRRVCLVVLHVPVPPRSCHCAAR